MFGELHLRLYCIVLIDINILRHCRRPRLYKRDLTYGGAGGVNFPIKLEIRAHCTWLYLPTTPLQSQ